MDIEEFRKRGYEAVDRICKYYKELDNHNVLPNVRPGYLKELLPKEAPEEPESFDAIQSDIETKIIPGVTHWQSPNFFAFYPANSSFPGILGDMYSDMFGCIGFNWITSPACTELETIVLDWVGKLIGLDKTFLSDGYGGGVIQGTASEATLVALIAARQRVIDKYKAEGLTEEQLHVISSRLIAYGSTQTHSCLKKSTMIANVRFRALSTDEKFSLRGDTIKREIEKDISQGLIPCFLNGTIGTTSSAAVDHISELADAIQGTDVWLHIDAAYAGSALVCPEYQHYLDGVDRADSFNFNMHKWLLTNFDTSCLWVKRRKLLISALTITPEFLKNPASESGLVLDYRDWQLPLGRRFRSLKIWFVLRTYGAKGLREHIRKSISLAKHFQNRLLSEYSDLFAISTEQAFSLVCFHVIPNVKSRKTSNELTEEVYNRVNETQKIYLTHTKLNDQFVIRFVVGSPWTAKEHVDRAFDLIVKITKEAISH
ncbi:tyrosine decarboxylase 1-like protein [Gigaspora rosea]|uniref:Tyrosine decarboxylase 1-like protein n=1 Tax=Gigaspora rosea TaxID=44941 RepID=A0A397UXY9_9GLOM|nr:tyrosine decarboxylase 1-like protein [Gigaspora rosea]